MLKLLNTISQHWQLRYLVIKLNLWMTEFTRYMIVKIIFTNNTTYTKLETNLITYFMKLDKIEMIILILVKTLQI